MRRTFGLALAALLALAMLAAPAAADDAVAAQGEVVLAVDDAPPGPEPMDRNDPDNPARELAGFEDPEVPFTWYAAFLLLIAGSVGLVLLVGLYYLLVKRPSQRSSGSS
jgi:ABC-type amino acid transport substrate-binding protein